jgi:imidazolonepropionase-like amidohydrolase
MVQPTSRVLHFLAATVLAATSISAACSQPAPETGTAQSTAVLYDGARIIPADGSAPFERGALLVAGRITRVGAQGEVTAPAGATRVDLTGKTVMPALLGAHGHVGYQKGLTFLRENYTRENILNDLNRAAYFGMGTILTLGIDTPQFIYELREYTANGQHGGARLRTAGTGIGGPNAGPGNTVYSRGVAYEVTTEEEGRAAVRDVAPHKPDLVKIWLDVRGGRGQKISPPVVRAIVDEAAKHGLKVIAHVRDHGDAEVAVASGVYALAHLARDREMSDALVADIVKRGVYVTPTLSMAERNNYAGAVPAWFEEPGLMALLTATLTKPELDLVKQGFIERTPEQAANAANAYGILHRTVQKLNAAGARVVLGGDTGLPQHYWGLAEHRELELLVAAGLTTSQAIVASTSRAAEFLSLPDLGTLSAGKIADFLVLDANPLDDIRHTRRISSLYIQGKRVDREAMRAKWQAIGGS